MCSSASYFKLGLRFWFVAKMSERKFSRVLNSNKAGVAAQLRDSVSQVVRQSTALVSNYTHITYIHTYLQVYINVFMIAQFSRYAFRSLYFFYCLHLHPYYVMKLWLAATSCSFAFCIGVASSRKGVSVVSTQQFCYCCHILFVRTFA